MTCLFNAQLMYKNLTDTREMAFDVWDNFYWGKLDEPAPSPRDIAPIIDHILTHI